MQRTCSFENNIGATTSRGRRCGANTAGGSPAATPANTTDASTNICVVMFLVVFVFDLTAAASFNTVATFAITAVTTRTDV